MKNICKWISLFSMILGVLFLIPKENQLQASIGICGDAAEMGVCVGDGAKCNIKKGILTFRCGKDPKGPSIELE